MATSGEPGAPPFSARYRVVERCVAVETRDPVVASLVRAVLGGFAPPLEDRRADIRYRLPPARRPATPRAALPGPALLVHDMLRKLTVDLQRLRTDLLFLHSAVVARRGRAILLVGESGSGKSTTTWRLLHHGFEYLSDELAPVDVDAGWVHPYHRALALKLPLHTGEPPLPAGAVELVSAVHVPVACLPSAAPGESRPIDAIAFVDRRAESSGANLRPLSAAEAGVRLYGGALNLLTHPNRGLDAVLRLARSVRCFALATADLEATADVLDRLID